jgi:hypothetical protein
MEQNPYNAPQSAPSRTDHDNALLRRVIRRLLLWRTRPPTIVRILFSWRSVPLFAILGFTAALLYFFLDLSREFILFDLGMCFGVVLRDIGLARITARLWPLQEPLFDWNKIEDQARELNL